MHLKINLFPQIFIVKDFDDQNKKLAIPKQYFGMSPKKGRKLSCEKCQSPGIATKVQVPSQLRRPAKFDVFKCF